MSDPAEIPPTDAGPVQVPSKRLSHHKANRVARVLSGQRLKYTVRLVNLEGFEVEFQSGKVPELDFDYSARSLVLKGYCGDQNDRESFTVCTWQQGMIMVCEINP